MASLFRLGVLTLAVALAVPALAGCTTPLPWSPEGKNQRSGPGDHALDFIRGSPYSKLHIVVDYVKGAEPNEAALNVLVATAREVLDKKEVTLTKHENIPAKGADHAYTFKEVNEIELEHRRDYTGGDTAVMYFLYLDGVSEKDTKDGSVLGAAYRGSSVVMFKNNIRKAVEQNKGQLGGLLGPSTQQMETIVERAVLVHEMGHLLGLVDNGIPMQKDRLDRDPNHTPKHSTNPKSVMYWAVENTGGLKNFLQGNTDIPYRFDEDDKADINAAKKTG